MKINPWALLFIAYLPAFAFSQPTLEKQKLFDGQIEIQVPNSFHFMTEEERKIKYPPFQYPSIAYTDKKLEVNLLIRYINTITIASEGLDDYRDQQIGYVQKKIPDAKLLTKGDIVVHDSLVAYFKVLTPTTDHAFVVNYYFFTCLKGHMLMGNLNCAESRWSEWEKPFDETIRSITWL